MQLNKKIVLLGQVIVIINILFLQSCQNAQTQECGNMQKIIKDNTTEINAIRAAVKAEPLPDGRPASAMRIAELSSTNDKLSQDYQIKCGK